MTTVGIHQIYYDNKQLIHLDTDSIPYDNSAYCKVIPMLENEREYRVFKDNYEAKTHLEYDYTGFFSWKYKQKTKGGTIEQFKKRMMNEKYTHDVYFTSCGPRVTNVWRQGNNRSPYLIELTQHVLDATGVDINLSSFTNTVDQCCFCNFWVGNSTFWDTYFEFTKPIYNFLTNSENTFTENQWNKFNTKADPGVNANYFPFIMERLFTTLIVTNNTIKYKKL